MISCSSHSSETSSLWYDAEVAARYRALLPTMDDLTLKTPQGVSLFGRPALPAGMPELTESGTRAAREALWEIGAWLQDATGLEPTLFNAKTGEMIFGPAASGVAFGTAALYVAPNPTFNPDFDIADPNSDGSPLEYFFIYLRGPNYDVNQLVPILVGGRTLELNDLVSDLGMILWDLDAHQLFEKRFNVSRLSDCNKKGRVAVLMQGSNFVQLDERLTVRLFQYDAPGLSEGPLSAWLQGGELISANSTVGYLNFETDMMIQENARTIEAKTAFFTYLPSSPGGSGRGEFRSVDTLATTSTLSGVECWGEDLGRTYFQLVDEAESQSTVLEEEGDLDAGCNNLMRKELEILGVPDLASLEDFAGPLLRQLTETGIDGLLESLQGQDLPDSWTEDGG